MLARPAAANNGAVSEVRDVSALPAGLYFLVARWYWFGTRNGGPYRYERASFVEPVFRVAGGTDRATVNAATARHTMTIAALWAATSAAAQQPFDLDPSFETQLTQEYVTSVLVVEDGPTLTHGEMAYGAGYVAARRFGAKEIVDPRPFAVGSIARTFEKYPKTGAILPAMGYGDKQTRELEETINKSDVDMVVIGTPIDLSRVIKINKPSQRVRYELQEIGVPTLKDVLMKKFGVKK